MGALVGHISLSPALCFADLKSVSVSVSVIFWKLIRKQFKSVSVISGVQV